MLEMTSVLYDPAPGSFLTNHGISSLIGSGNASGPSITGQVNSIFLLCGAGSPSPEGVGSAGRRLVWRGSSGGSCG